jgi:hypothetical protein
VNFVSSVQLCDNSMCVQRNFSVRATDFFPDVVPGKSSYYALIDSPS